MNIQVEDAGPSRKQISIQVPADDVDKCFRDVTGGFMRHARIPGFRPGKAPVKLVRNRFQKDILKEVKEHLVPRGYHEAIRRENIEAVRVIEVSDPEPAEGQPYLFNVTVDVFPEFDLPEYKKIKVEAASVEVTPEAIDEVVDRMRSRMADYVDEAGRVAEKGDRVVINYKATIDGAPLSEVAPNHAMLAGAEEFGLVLDPDFAFIPELGDAMVGTSEGQSKSVEVTFPEDFVEKALSGKKAVYEVAVVKVQARTLPDITPEFLKSLGVESVEALRERITEDLARMKADQERRRVQDEVCKQLLDQTAMNLPDSEVQRQTADEVFDLVQYNTSRGIDRNVIEENREQIFSAASKTASDKIKLRFILLRIARAESIEVSHAEVDSHIRVLAQRTRRDAEKVRAELEKNNRMSALNEDVLASKALDFLMQLQQPEAAAS